MIDILSICRNAETIGISGHIRPDGDCTASTIGLQQYLQKHFPNKKIDVRIEQPSSVFQCIKGFDSICTEQSNVIYDVFFVCDSIPDRIGDAQSYYENAKQKIVIDHHISNTMKTEWCYILPEASSTSEMIFNLIEYVDPTLKYLDEEIAKTLYIGIIHDCGVFQYSNTSKRTLEIAAKLISYGFDFPMLIDETFYEKTRKQNRVLGYVLQKYEQSFEESFSYAVLTLSEIEQLHAEKFDYEGIVNQLRYTKNTSVAAFLYETEPSKFKTSLRSNGDVDVSKVCMCFGGGGHIRAAGCIINGTSKEVIDKIHNEIEKQMEQTNV